MNAAELGINPHRVLRLLLLPSSSSSLTASLIADSLPEPEPEPDRLKSESAESSLLTEGSKTGTTETR